jgi:hypothetical protein
LALQHGLLRKVSQVLSISLLAAEAAVAAGTTARMVEVVAVQVVIAPTHLARAVGVELVQNQHLL